MPNKTESFVNNNIWRQFLDDLGKYIDEKDKEATFSLPSVSSHPFHTL